MSSGEVIATDPIGQSAGLVTLGVRRPGVGAWIWAAIACTLLGSSGAIRAMQDHRHQDEKNYKEACPIQLAAIPNSLGVWHLVKDGDKKLDDLTMRITGGTDHLIRTYVDDLTGVSVDVLILYGPAVPVLPHTPEVCYPASGFRLDDTSLDQTVNYSLAGNSAEGATLGKARFRAAVYAKPAGRMTLRQQVYHSFRLDGRWSPDIGSSQKFPRRNPGVFKVQIQRRVIEGETLGQGDPIEQFLSILITEIEKEISNSAVKVVASR